MRTTSKDRVKADKIVRAEPRTHCKDRLTRNRKGRVRTDSKEEHLGESENS